MGVWPDAYYETFNMFTGNSFSGSKLCAYDRTSMLAGAAALLYTLKVPQGIIYSGGFLLGIKAFSAAVLGGIGNLRGALLGGLLLGVMENYGQALFGTQWRDVVAFVLLVVVLLFRPTGILGESLGKARV